jgi:Carboxypeptidase regulatory-like domain
LWYCWCSDFRLNAQVATGDISVTVANATGATVPEASIEVSNNATGLSRTGLANDRGELQIPFLPVGPYSVTAEYTGLKKTTIASVMLQLDQTPRFA